MRAPIAGRSARRRAPRLAPPARELQRGLPRRRSSNAPPRFDRYARQTRPNMAKIAEKSHFCMLAPCSRCRERVLAAWPCMWVLRCLVRSQTPIPSRRVRHHSLPNTRTTCSQSGCAVPIRPRLSPRLLPVCCTPSLSPLLRALAVSASGPAPATRPATSRAARVARHLQPIVVPCARYGLTSPEGRCLCATRLPGCLSRVRSLP